MCCVRHRALTPLPMPIRAGLGLCFLLHQLGASIWPFYCCNDCQQANGSPCFIQQRACLWHERRVQMVQLRRSVRPQIRITLAFVPS